MKNNHLNYFYNSYESNNFITSWTESLAIVPLIGSLIAWKYHSLLPFLNIPRNRPTQSGQLSNILTPIGFLLSYNLINPSNIFIKLFPLKLFIITAIVDI